VIQAEGANDAALAYIIDGKPFWSHVSEAKSDDGTMVTWLLSGTLPDWGGTPLVIVVVLEENNTELAETIRANIFDTVLKK
jgi:hypothetical protein